MMKNMLALFLIVFLLVSVSRAQDQYKGHRTIIAGAVQLKAARFHVYTPPFIARAIYQDTIEAVNQYPEQLISSVLAADDQAWVNYNTLGGQGEEKTEEHFQKVATMNKEECYYELRSKLTFAHEGKQIAMIKFYVHLTDLPKPVSGSITLQKVGERWYVSPLPNTSHIYTTIRRFQSDKLLQIMKEESDGSVMMSELIANTRSANGSFDMNLLVETYYDWKRNQRQPEIDYFMDPNAW